MTSLLSSRMMFGTGEWYHPQICDYWAWFGSGCYGCGSHFLLEKHGLAKVCHIKEKIQPLWIDIIHEENVDNDVKMTFDTYIVHDKNMLRRVFSLYMDIESLHFFAFILRSLKQM